MAHILGHRPSVSDIAQRGLLERARGGRALLGPNIKMGVGLGPNRNTVIAPNPFALDAATSAINRWSPPGIPAPRQQTVMNTGGVKMADLFKDARFGQLADRVPQGSLYTPVAPGDIRAPGIPAAPLDVAAPGTTPVEGPQGLMGKVGGFFKRAAAQPGMGASLMAAGGAMMSGRDAQGRAYTDPFQSIGAGLQAGMGTYEGLKAGRREQTDWEEDERRRKEINAGIDASIGEMRDADGNITRRALTDVEAAEVRAAGGAAGVALARDYRQGTRKRDAINKFAIGADSTFLDLLMSYGNDEALDKVVAYAESEEGLAGRIAHLEEMGYSPEVARVAGKDAASTQAVLNRGMDTTIMMDGSGVLRIFHKGEFVGSAGEGRPEITAADAENLELARQSTLWDQSSGARQLVRDEHTRLTASVEALPNLVETVEAINEAPPKYFDATGKLKLHVDNWLGLDDRDLGQQVDQMLTAFGILNLDAFTGAISDRELVVALANAGEVGKPVEMINAILARSINQTIDAATRQNTRALEMDRMLASTEVAQAAVDTGQAGLWTNQFGFDMGTEGELGDDGLYTGGTGLSGYKMRADQAMTDMLDAARQEAGNLIMVDPETGEAAQPLTPAQTISGFRGGQSVVSGIAGIPSLLADPFGEAARRWYGDDTPRPGLTTRSDFDRQRTPD